MLNLLATALTTALALLVIVAVVLGMLRVTHLRAGSAASARYRAVLAAVAVAVGTLVIGVGLGLEGPTSTAVAVVAMGLSVLAWTPLLDRWDDRGVVAWALAVDAGFAYVAYVAVWTLTADISMLGRFGSLALLPLEALAVLVGLGYVWEFVDARARWAVEVPATPLARDRGHRPFVSVHVTTDGDLPDGVIACLERLLELDYEAYEIILVDNGAINPVLWRPIETSYAHHSRVKFLHVGDGPVTKGAALNHALRHTDPRADVVSIVDADQLVDADFLRDCAPAFADSSVSVVQTTPDYREWGNAAYTRRLRYAYSDFFDLSNQSLPDRNGAAFGGGLILLRRTALDSVGGWDEWCIAGRIELSLLLLRAGGRAVNVDWSYGDGVLPLTFEALKRQRLRWSFGGVQLLRRHWRSLLLARRSEPNTLTSAQRRAYLVGRPTWLGGLGSMLLTALLLLGAVDAIVASGAVARRLTGPFLLGAFLLGGLAAGRALARLRRTSGATWGETAGAIGLRLAVDWAATRGAIRGLLARRAGFAEPPAAHAERQTSSALRGNLTEAVLGLACAILGTAAILQRSPEALLVGGLLLVRALGFLLAPANSLTAIRAQLPRELGRLRGMLLTPPTRSVPLRGAMLATAAMTVVALLALTVATVSPSDPGLSVSDDGDSPAATLRPPTASGDAPDRLRPTDRTHRSNPSAASGPSSRRNAGSTIGWPRAQSGTDSADPTESRTTDSTGPTERSGPTAGPTSESPGSSRTDARSPDSGPPDFEPPGKRTIPPRKPSEPPERSTTGHRAGTGPPRHHV